MDACYYLGTDYYPFYYSVLLVLRTAVVIVDSDPVNIRPSGMDCPKNFGLFSPHVPWLSVLRLSESNTPYPGALPGSQCDRDPPTHSLLPSVCCKHLVRVGQSALQTKNQSTRQQCLITATLAHDVGIFWLVSRRTCTSRGLGGGDHNYRVAWIVCEYPYCFLVWQLRSSLDCKYKVDDGRPVES